jgi:hypothetical protein
MRIKPILMICASTLVGCPSPVSDDAIDKLGGECDGVGENEFHRAGQPCVLCHGEYLAVGPIMALGGTIFATPSQPVPVEGVRVTLTDANGVTMEKTTNCIGNFFFTAEEWTPAFPVHAEITCPIPGTEDTRRLVMGTRVSRDGSCAGCHFGPPAFDSPGWVYCAAVMPDPAYTVSATCDGVCDGG